jgi:ADP-ribosylglycohydrolase
MRFEDRVIGCFRGLATGDAIGKQTETLTREGVREWYPQGIAGFHGKPGEVIPRYRGKRYEWRIGETTDDTEQTAAVARAILREGTVSHAAIGRDLLHCKKSIHPGVSMWSFMQAGDPARVASEGDGCGAAMRVAPVGVLYRSDLLEEVVSGAYECAIPTHAGDLAIGAAAAVAGAVSAALEGRAAEEVLQVAMRAAAMSSGAPPIARSIESIYADLSAGPRTDVVEIAQRYFPDRTEIIVPLAIGLALVTESAEETALIAANLGGDADSVASIGGAIAGALCPATVNAGWWEAVSRINDNNLVDLGVSLAAIRDG